LVSTNDMILLYHPDMEKTASTDPPYAAIFQKMEKTLVFVAARHVFTKEHPTLVLIARMMDASVPEILIQERTDSEMGRPHELGEISFAKHEAIKRGLKDIRGGEPEHGALEAALMAAGYTHEDFRFFHFARQISCAVRFGNANIREMARKSLRDIPFSDFRDWFHVHIGRADRNSLGKTSPYAPIMDGTHTQCIAATEGQVRDQNIFKTIRQALAKKNRVMVVYGASHFLTLRPALEALMGQPNIIPGAGPVSDGVLANL